MNRTINESDMLMKKITKQARDLKKKRSSIAYKVRLTSMRFINKFFKW